MTGIQEDKTQQMPELKERHLPEDSREAQPWRIFDDREMRCYIRIIKKDSDTGNDVLNKTAKYRIYDLDKTGFSSEAEFSGWSFRVFGGMSINLALFKIDVTGMYNFIDKNYGISLGTRLQI